MLRALAGNERTVGRLAAPFEMSLAAASKHVRVLERAGLVQRAVAGRTHRLWLAPGPLAGAHHWLGFYERFWSGRIDILERLLREEAAMPVAPARNVTPPPNRVPDPADANAVPTADPTLSAPAPAEPLPSDLPSPAGDAP